MYLTSTLPDRMVLWSRCAAVAKKKRAAPIRHTQIENRQVTCVILITGRGDLVLIHGKAEPPGPCPTRLTIAAAIRAAEYPIGLCESASPMFDCTAGLHTDDTVQMCMPRFCLSRPQTSISQTRSSAEAVLLTCAGAGLPRACSSQDTGALCLSSANVGSALSIARGTGSLSSTKLRTALSGRPRACVPTANLSF